MSISGAIFDMDGTLIDSMHVWSGMSGIYLKSKGKQYDAEFEREIKALSVIEGLKAYVKHYGLEETPEQMAEDMRELMREFYKSEAAPFDGIIELLEHFKATGVKMCVATATDTDLAEIALAKCNLRHYFSEVFSCKQIGKGKGSPDIYRAALSHLGTEKSTTWVFEDAKYAAKCAKDDGFNVVGIHDHSEPLTDTMAEFCDIYVKDRKDIIGHFTK